MKTTKFFKPNVPIRMKNLDWPQSEKRFPLLNPKGDVDRDGVKNFRDCKPFDIKRQGEGHMNKDDYGFRFVYKRKGKKKSETPTAEELIEELD